MVSERKTLITAIITVAKMTILLSSLVMAALLSRLLDKSDYGAFRQILMLYAITSTAFAVSIPQSIYYYLPRLQPSEQKGFIYQSMGLLFIFGALIGVFLFFGAGFIGRTWHNESLSSMLRVFAVYPALMLPVLAIESILMTFRRIATIFTFSIVSKALQVVAVVLPIYLGYSIVYSIYVWMIFSVLQLVAAVWLVKNVVNCHDITFEWKFLTEQIKYALPLSTAAIMGSLGLNIDKIMVSTFGNPRMYAVYSNGAFELPIVGVIGVAVTITVLPVMTLYAKEKKTDEFLGLWYRSQAKVAFILFPIWLYCLLFANGVVVLLFGRAYSESTVIFQIYLLLLPTRLCTFNRILGPLNKNWIYTKGHMIQLIFEVILCYIAFRKFGITGAAVGLVSSIYLNVIYTARASSKLLGIGFFKIWPLKILWKYFLFAAISSIVAYAVCNLIPEQMYIQKIVRLTLGFVLTGIVYLLLAWKFGMLDWREWISAMSWKKRQAATISK